jgi:Flp pilus assembly protein TadD
MLQPDGSRDFSISRDGRTIAWPRGAAGGLVFDAADPTRLHRLQPLRSCDGITLSPDGRWAITGSHYVKEGLHLWDARTGRLVHDFSSLPDEVGAVTSFSPDGRWLSVLWDGHLLFDTTTWTPGRRLFRGVTKWLTFAPDSRTAVYDDNAGTLILVEVKAGRELARLEDPEQVRINIGLAFTPDGSRLVTTLAERPYLRVWDLRAIRRRLAGLGLDWDPPASFDTPDAPGSFPPFPKPFRVDRGQFDSWLGQSAEPPEQVLARTTQAIEANPDDAEAHHQRGHALFRVKRYEEAIADFSAALKARPDDAHPLISRALAEAGRKRLDAVIADGEAALRLRSGRPKAQEPDSATKSLALFCNNQAWTLATGPASGRDPARALALARLAVELAPDQAIYLNTLGVACYRAARYVEAVPILERSLAAAKGESDAFDLFFLAMARHRLGDAASARADFDRAVRWIDAHPHVDARWLTELKSFRAESETVLADPPGELPADVFAPATDR